VGEISFGKKEINRLTCVIPGVHRTQPRVSNFGGIHQNSMKFDGFI
jgi:hypothetical protein